MEQHIVCDVWMEDADRNALTAAVTDVVFMKSPHSPTRINFIHYDPVVLDIVKDGKLYNGCIRIVSSPQGVMDGCVCAFAMRAQHFNMQVQKGHTLTVSPPLWVGLGRD